MKIHTTLKHTILSLLICCLATSLPTQATLRRPNSKESRLLKQSVLVGITGIVGLVGVAALVSACWSWHKQAEQELLISSPKKNGEQKKEDDGIRTKFYTGCGLIFLSGVFAWVTYMSKK